MVVGALMEVQVHKAVADELGGLWGELQDEWRRKGGSGGGGAEFWYEKWQEMVKTRIAMIPICRQGLPLVAD